MIMNNSDDQEPRVLYILSPSYSGSTLLTFMLAAHPDVATVGELKASKVGTISDYPCSCGRLFLECPFWLELEQEMQRMGEDFSLMDFGTHFYTDEEWFSKAVKGGAMGGWPQVFSRLSLGTIPAWRGRLNRLRHLNRAVIDAVTRIQGGWVFLDGSKDPERLLQMEAEMPEKVFVLWLTRDGRGAVNSYRKHHGFDVGRAARRWAKVAENCHRVASRFPKNRVMKLQYELFCEDPAARLKEMFQFVGLQEKEVENRQELHILGNSMRVRDSRPIVLDEKWRRELSNEDLEVFERVAGTTNRRLGYSDLASLTK